MHSTHAFAMPYGASLVPEGGVRFRLYAPGATAVDLAWGARGDEHHAAMEALPEGWFERHVAEATAGTRYTYAIDGGDLRVPDPASRLQAADVHSPSVVVDPAAFEWPDDGWVDRPWHEQVVYELHVGTFSPEGTYAGAAAHLRELAALGVTTVELMPLADVPGARNWGYDGVLLYAPSHNYGSPEELKAFVRDAHAAGLGVMIDVVYNHFGPEGNYLHAYAPHFWTERHHTPWGAAIDVERDDREFVREFFICNAIYWLREYRFDGIRFDAVHAIYDGDRRRFLRELADRVRGELDRSVHLVLENANNEAPLLESDFVAQWNDDAHHAAHVLATGETDGYYADYATEPARRLARTLAEGFGFQGEWSEHEGAYRGTPSAQLPITAFVTFVQNHDQVGNRPFGDRLAAIAPPEALRAILAVVLLAPPVPMLFMGEEWAASAPFQFFCDFGPELAPLVRDGRREEFKAFAAFSGPDGGASIPDPGDAATFERSRLDWSEREREPHRTWLAYYTELLALRHAEIAPRNANLPGTSAVYAGVGAAGMRVTWSHAGGETLSLRANLGATPEPAFVPEPAGRTIFATDGAAGAAVMPPWSVVWTIA